MDNEQIELKKVDIESKSKFNEQELQQFYDIANSNFVVEKPTIQEEIPLSDSGGSQSSSSSGSSSDSE